MKKIFTLFAAGTLILAGCSSDDDNSVTPIPDDKDKPASPILSLNLNSSEISYNAEGYWSKYDINENLHLDGFRLNHYLTVWNTVEGFILSKNQDVTFHDPMYTHPYTVVGGGGVNGLGSPYIVATWATNEDPQNPSLTINRNNFEEFSPKTIIVNNTTYAYYTMKDGNDFCHAFRAGDWFKLTIHGIDSEGEEKCIDFMLADCTSTNHPEAEIVSSWTTVDLTPLGKVKKIYFTLSSSDSGQWGMNTPGYFAIGGFTYTL